MRGFFAFVLAALLCLPPLPLGLAARPAAALVVDITSGEWQPVGIVIEKFAGEDAVGGQAPSAIIANDLSASGQFLVSVERASDGRNMESRLEQVRRKNGEYLLRGKVGKADSGRPALEFALHDALTGDVVGAFDVEFTAANKRLAAHTIANWVYEEITNTPGVFHTKVLYVVRQGRKNELKIADYDGYNRQVILTSQTQIISPVWAASGDEVAYVSFERNKPLIYRQSLLDGKRRVVANFKGSNSAPAFSPDGLQVAAALTEHGGAQQLYLISANRKTRLRRSGGIDTEPVYSPDGKRLAFVSDEKGSPQIYEYNFDEGAARRLTFRSAYNASPDYSAAGDGIVFVRRTERGDNVTVMDLPGGHIAILAAAGGRADSPSFAPNDDMIIFLDGRKKSGKNLATVSINGKVVKFWAVPETGDIIDPDWGPLKSSWF